MPSAYIGTTTPLKLEFCRQFFEDVKPRSIDSIRTAIYKRTKMNVYFTNLIGRSMRCKRSSIPCLLETLMQQYPIFAEFLRYVKQRIACSPPSVKDEAKKQRVTTTKRKTVQLPTPTSDMLSCHSTTPLLKRKTAHEKEDEVVYVGLEQQLRLEKAELELQVTSLKQALAYARERYANPKTNVLNEFTFCTLQHA